MTSSFKNQWKEKQNNHQISHQEPLDFLKLPPRKEVHTKVKRKVKKKMEENETIQEQEVIAKQEELVDSRTHRREKKTEKKQMKWSAIVLRSILVLFIMTLIAIPLYYKWGIFNDDFQPKQLIPQNPAGEEIQFN